MKKLLIFIAVFFFSYSFANAQSAVLYNSTQLFSVDAGAVVFVDGDIVNSAFGHIQNKGDIYLTRDWINDEIVGALDPADGKVILAGTSQLITGTQITTFNNLDCQNTGTKTLNMNTIVGGNTGVLSLNNSPFDLNSNTLIVTNPLSAAITRNNGYIISETDFSTGSYGTIQWNLGNAALNYIYPFGTFSGTYIPFLFNVTTSGTGTNGNISVATYPTNVTASPNNLPLPNTVLNLTDPSSGNAAAPLCADRYWITTPFNYTTNPTAGITFSYVDSEWDNSGGSTNTIVEDSLRAWRWGGTQWQLPTLGSDNPTLNSVTVPAVNTFSIWTLKSAEPLPCGDFWLPNAFSPNGDGKNDIFKPRNNCIKTIDFRIYNRWGNLVFETDDPAKGWDGSTLNSKDGNEGVYVYILNATLNDGTAIEPKKGTVTLMK